MVFLAALCSSRRHRKTSTPKSPLSYPPADSTVRDPVQAESSLFLQPQLPPPLPPSIQAQDHPLQPPPSSPKLEKEMGMGDGVTLQRVASWVPRGKSTSRRKLSGSLSMSLPEGLPRIWMGVKKEQKTAPEREESIWKKTIILGDRCRVPSDDEEEVVLYDENGHRKRNYRPRTPRSLPVSRTNSFVNHDAD